MVQLGSRRRLHGSWPGHGGVHYWMAQLGSGPTIYPAADLAAMHCERCTAPLSGSRTWQAALRAAPNDGSLEVHLPRQFGGRHRRLHFLGGDAGQRDVREHGMARGSMGQMAEHCMLNFSTRWTPTSRVAGRSCAAGDNGVHQNHAGPARACQKRRAVDSVTIASMIEAVARSCSPGRADRAALKIRARQLAWLPCSQAVAAAAQQTARPHSSQPRLPW